MNTSLTFRKESIQQSSSMSAALNRAVPAPTQGQDPRRPGERWEPSLTTSFTTLD
ncbi:hypothetical protein GETHPA_28370 [Geothrix rubra]|uniref:Uncharacterized protein n=1 Tax=Geothrix rubra TaxID=2927977 RepID=A0ABQ5Q902_9BACT|nr:hypothetical protein [Geothrix rubra]GLH71304.1 hypothetical protein GETHPA_28370 [Geothrix rubra]